MDPIQRVLDLLGPRASPRRPGGGVEIGLQRGPKWTQELIPSTYRTSNSCALPYIRPDILEWELDDLSVPLRVHSDLLHRVRRPAPVNLPSLSLVMVTVNTPVLQTISEPTSALRSINGSPTAIHK